MCYASFASVNCHDLLKNYLEKLVVISNTGNCSMSVVCFQKLRLRIHKLIFIFILKKKCVSYRFHHHVYIMNLPDFTFF